MPTDIVDANTARFFPNDSILIDANVWLILEGPQSNPNDRRTISYTKAFKNISLAKAQIIMHPFVLSEFVNRYARLEHEAVKTMHPNFKEFRNHPAFVPVAESITAATRRITRDCSLVQCEISPDLDFFVERFAAGKEDFTDLMLARYCERHGYMLLTDDGDYANCNVQIVTANRKLLRR